MLDVEDLNPSYLLGDVGIHAVVGLPWVLGGVDVETSTSAKIPALIFAFDVAATLGGMTHGWSVTKALKMLKPHHNLHRDFTEQNQHFKTNRGNQHKDVSALVLRCLLSDGELTGAGVWSYDDDAVLRSTELTAGFGDEVLLRTRQACRETVKTDEPQSPLL